MLGLINKPRFKRVLLGLPFSAMPKFSHEFGRFLFAMCKVETPIRDNVRELVNWSEIMMNVLANPKGSVGRWNLNF